MITRMQMPRQLRNKGGITSVVPRTNYLFGGIKDRIRKIIPNEIASVASKAAPVVAPFSDALKQGAGTYAFGRGVRYLAGAEGPAGGLDTFSMDRFKQGPVGSLFNRQAANKEVFGAGDALGGEMLTTGGDKSLISVARDVARAGIKKLPDGVVAQLTAGGITAGASLLASYFQGEFEEPEEGETTAEYMERRRQYVGTQMRTYMDNYYANDPEYMKLDEAGKNALVARYNLHKGGMPTGIMRTIKQESWNETTEMKVVLYQ